LSVIAATTAAAPPAEMAFRQSLISCMMACTSAGSFALGAHAASGASAGAGEHVVVMGLPLMRAEDPGRHQRIC
jgi:glucose-6-phosphate dehydrogenase assembly protein OpcA